MGDKIVTVLSMVRNLNGDNKDQYPFISQSIAVQAMFHEHDSMSSAIKSALLDGPGLKIRNYGKWVDSSGYRNWLGWFSTGLGSMKIDQDILLTQLVPSGKAVIQKTFIGYGDFLEFARQHILSNFPTRIDEAWLCDYTGTTLTIEFPNGDLEHFDVDIDASSRYLYTTYKEIDDQGNPGPMIMNIYKQGSGNSVLDAFFVISNDTGYFPSIPTKVYNQYLDKETPGFGYHDQWFPFANRAFRKAFGYQSRFSSVNDSVRASPDHDKLDHTWLTFGVPINATDKAAQKYLISYFTYTNLQEDPNQYNQYVKAVEEDKRNSIQWDLYQAWLEAGGRDDPNMDGLPQLPGLHYPNPSVDGRTTGINFGTNKDGNQHYNNSIVWNGSNITTGSGLLKPDAKRGDVWLERGEDLTWQEYGYTSSVAGEDDGAGPYGKTHVRTYRQLVINYQVTLTSWIKIHIIELKGNKQIYGYWYFLMDALDDIGKTEESNMIIPLHNSVLAQMSLIDVTQMSTQCCYIEMFIHDEQSLPWYASDWFSVVIYVVSVILAFFTGGYTLSWIGVFNAMVNALVAAIIARIIMEIAMMVFGKKIGMIIGTLVALYVGSANQTGTFDVAANLGNLATIANLATIVIAIGNSYSNYIAECSKTVVDKATEYANEYAKKMTQISEAYMALVGDGRNIINPAMLTNAIINRELESPESFLSRTTMTCNELAETSVDMINNFVGITTSTSLNV